MAKDLTRHQQKIVNRYYEHQDTIRAEKLSDLVADLWLCEDQAKATKLWGRAQVALMRAGCNAQQVANVVGKRDTEGLAKLVKQVDAAPGAPGTSQSPAGKDHSSAAGDHKGTPLADGTPFVAANARSVADGRTIQQMQREKAAAAGTDSLESGNLKRAMGAFKKKLKTTRRDDESKLGGRYTTGGRASSIVAITPPHNFPSAVWEELARQGRLKKAGQGTYQMP